MDIKQIIIEEIQKYMKNVIIPIFIQNNIHFDEEMLKYNSIKFNQIHTTTTINSNSITENKDNIKDIYKDSIDNSIKDIIKDTIDDSIKDTIDNSINNTNIEITNHNTNTKIENCSISTLLRHVTNSTLISFDLVNCKKNDINKIFIDDWNVLKDFINTNYKIICNSNRKIIEFLKDYNSKYEDNINYSITILKDNIQYRFEYLNNSNIKKKNSKKVTTKLEKLNSEKPIINIVEDTLDSSFFDNLEIQSNNSSEFNLDEFKEQLLNHDIQRFRLINKEY